MTADRFAVANDFSAAILRTLLANVELAEMSVPRLSKSLGQSASAVMRQLTLLGDVCGVGWVNVVFTDGRFMVRLTSAGLVAANELVADSKRVQQGE